jgi:hypothetical protein
MTADLKVVGTATPAPDAADLSDLWLDPALGDGLTDVVLHSIPVGKPRDFFRVHPSKDFRRQGEIYTHKPEGQIEEQHFLITKSMWGRIEEARRCTVVVCVYRDGNPRLWPLKTPKSGEKDNEAWSTARVAARNAIDRWVKLVWIGRSYQTRDAELGYAPDPDWTKLPSWDQLVDLGFGPHGVIRDTNHPMFRSLVGAAPKKSDGDDGDL